MRPTLDRVVVKLHAPQTKTSSGLLYIPETAKEKGVQRGTAISVGPGRPDNNGKLIPMEVQEDDVVLFSQRYKDGDVPDEEGKLIIIIESDILAVEE